MAFNIGDTVKLKSGGDTMTVEDLSDGLVDCVWSHDHKIIRDSFKPEALKAYTPGSGGVAQSRSF